MRCPYHTYTPEKKKKTLRTKIVRSALEVLSLSYHTYLKSYLLVIAVHGLLLVDLEGVLPLATRAGTRLSLGAAPANFERAKHGLAPL